MITCTQFIKESSKSDKDRIRESVFYLKSIDNDDSVIKFLNRIISNNIITIFLSNDIDFIVDNICLSEKGSHRIKNADRIKLVGRNSINLLISIYKLIHMLYDAIQLIKKDFIQNVVDYFAIVEDYIECHVELSYDHKNKAVGFIICLIPIYNTNYKTSFDIIDGLSKSENMDIVGSICAKIERLYNVKTEIFRTHNIINCKINSSINESKSNEPNIKRHEIDGFIVYQGRDAISNDILTFQWTDDDDLWFHVTGSPGSHCVIKIKDKLPTEITIKKVAELAKKNSKAKTQDKATVIYCKRKFVKKESNMNSGQVNVDRKNAYFLDV